MKKYKIIYWATTGLLFLTQGIIPILTINATETKEAMSYLGYPSYFGLMLAIFKLLGGAALIIPQVPTRVKEWAYAGFAFDFTAAFISLAIVDGFSSSLSFSTIALIILMMSYWTYHKIVQKKILTNMQ